MPPSKTKILVAGLGAIGGFFGAFLAQNKELDVSFFSRGKTLEHFKTNPLVIKSYKFSEITFFPVVSGDVLSIKKKFDYIFICTKSKDTLALIKQIKKLIKQSTVIVTLQNGLYNYRVLKKAFGAKNVLQAICKIGVEMREDFVVDHTSLGFMQIGEFDGKKSTRIKKLEAILKESGIDARMISNIKEETWIKFAWNSIFNTVTYIFSETIDQFFWMERLEDPVMPLYNEITLVAKSQGIKFGGTAFKKIITDTKTLGTFKTSAYQDRIKSKESETIYFLSELIEMAKKKKLRVPTLKNMYKITDMLHKNLFFKNK